MDILIKNLETPLPKNGELLLVFASDENDKNTICLITDPKTGKAINHEGIEELKTFYDYLNIKIPFGSDDYKNIKKKYNITTESELAEVLNKVHLDDIRKMRKD